MTLDLDSLRCFEAGATELHFGRAARKVGLSPSAFSERIRRLEDELGATLFERSTRHVILSEAGQRLLPQAQACLRAAEGCHRVIHGQAPANSLNLVIGTRYELGMSWLLPALGELRDASPHRRVHLVFGDTSSLVESMFNGQADGIITSARLSHPRMVADILHEERYTFVMEREMAMSKALSSPSDIAKFTLLDIDGSCPLFRYFREANPEVSVEGGDILSLGTIAAVRHEVLRGQGVAVLPTYFVQGDLEAGRLVAPYDETPMNRDFFRLIWRRGHPLEGELRLLGAALRTFPLK